MSSSPTAKRNIKPSPTSASTSHFALSASDPSSLHPLNQAPQQNLDSFNPFPQQPQIQQQHIPATVAQPGNPRKRRAEGPPGVTQVQNVSIAPASSVHQQPPHAGPSSGYADSGVGAMATASTGRPAEEQTSPTQPPAKKGRTNTPWTPAEEQRLKQMRDAGNSWSEIAKTFPARTEGSVKKHWYKDMHYAEFAADEEAALLNAIKEYEANKWKVIGQKVGKPAKACEQYAKEHFAGRI